jgi:hypothetical protein
MYVARQRSLAQIFACRGIPIGFVSEMLVAAELFEVSEVGVRVGVEVPEKLT